MRRIKLVLALAAVLVATLVATAGPAMADNDRLRCNERESNDNDTIVCNERGDRDDREVFVEADEFFDEFGFPIFVVLDDNCDGIDDDGDLAIDEDGFCVIGFDGDFDLDLDDLGPDF
jgi:hypothetical protein